MSSSSKYTKDVLSPVVADSTSIAGVLRALGLRDTGGNRTHLKRNLVKFDISTIHFLGQGHNRGNRANNKKDYTHYLVIRPKGSARLSSSTLRRAMLEYGLEYKCAGDDCGLSVWKNKPITLETDHISGDHLDNRPSNLRFMCPNCHTQEPTSSHSWKNTERSSVASKCSCGSWKTSSAKTCKSCYNSKRKSL